MGCSFDRLNIVENWIGRKKVLLMPTVGMVSCEAFRLLVSWQLGRISLRVIWTAPLFKPLGGGDALAVLLVIVPSVTKILLSRFGVATGRQGLLFLSTSADMITAGTLLLRVANQIGLIVSSLVVFALENGLVTVGKSLLMTLGSAEMAETLLSAMNPRASVGAMLAGSLIVVAFNWGLKQGRGIWLGAPLLLVTVLYALALVSMRAIEVLEKCQQIYDDVAVARRDA
ncbi:MFS general substrate transporter [Apiospora hydei]|uniref:MFS general substrate transporter n=1 Tax=Apiospora hydei TaxID=1337664 RepID=A0ABR1WLL1_9PEZI